MTRLHRVLATWFGSGYFPIASGTAGTAATIPLVLLLWWIGRWPLHLAAAALIFALGLWAAKDAETYWRRKDPGQVVIDETAGYLLTTLPIGLAVPSFEAPGGWIAPLGVSFLLFRAMDIVKPWPARRLEALPGSLGIMIDDMFAGAYALLLQQAAFWALRRGGLWG